MTKPKSPPPSPRIISMQGEVKPLKGYAVVTYKGDIDLATFGHRIADVKSHFDSLYDIGWPAIAAKGYRIIRVDIIPSGETKP